MGNSFSINKLYYPGYDKNPSKAVLKSGDEITIVNFNRIIHNKSEIIGFRAFGSSSIIFIPFNMTPKLAYLIGIIFGDGSILKPIKRKAGGYYWIVEIYCNGKHKDIILKLVKNIFNYPPVITKDKRRKNSWKIQINSLIIHRFLNKVVGIPFGKKTGQMPWLNILCKSPEIFMYFLAGLIDSDGHVTNYVINLTQKDKQFLEKVKFFSKKLLNINFRGPYINKKINNLPVAWCLQLHKTGDVNNFINTIPLRYCPEGL